MTAESFFAHDYAGARDKFLSAHRQVGARIENFKNPTAGPNAETLTTDVAWIGPDDAENVLLTISGTHGAEGFCGSGVQVGWIETGLYKEMPENTALMQVHAINPHGFAWLRRVTEDNVDLNRNFIDHGLGDYPRNEGYEELAEAICPPEWTDAVVAECDRILEAYAEKHGLRALQAAVSSGQYSHADGIFYGGRAPTWSRTALEKILQDYLGKARRIGIIDYHTGLGPRGYGERICVHIPGEGGLERAAEWYDGDITSPVQGTSASVPLHGVNLLGIEKLLSHAQTTAVALEYGTIDTRDVKYALRADNWLHAHGQHEMGTAKGKEIKRRIRDAFYQDAADWKDMIWERAVETQRKALAGMSES